MADAVDELGSRGAFDLFVHATQFFGYKVNFALQRSSLKSRRVLIPRRVPLVSQTEQTSNLHALYDPIIHMGLYPKGFLSMVTCLKYMRSS